MTGYTTKPIDQRAPVAEIMRDQGGEADAEWVGGIAAQSRIPLRRL
jgi:hypothetical protein